MDAEAFWSVGDYGSIGDLWSAPARDVIAHREVRGRRVIDLATGTGAGAIAAAEAGAVAVVGVDITQRLLDEAARRAQTKNLDISWVKADVMAVPLPDAWADVVTSTFGLVFAADPACAVSEARRLMREDGELVITSWSPRGLFGAIRRVMAAYFPDAPEPWHETVAGLTTVVGPDARVEEHDFELVVESPEAFVSLMERHSAPIVLAASELGGRWPGARARLVDAVREASARSGDAVGVRVPYWVTTVGR